MNEQEKEMIERITKVESAVSALNERVDRHEKLIDSIQSLATSVKCMGENVEKLEGKVDELCAKPAKRWDSVVVAVLGAVAGGLGTAIVTVVLGG